VAVGIVVVDVVVAFCFLLLLFPGQAIDAVTINPERRALSVLNCW
jgi:hypothetical protein